MSSLSKRHSTDFKDENDEHDEDFVWHSLHRSPTALTQYALGKRKRSPTNVSTQFKATEVVDLTSDDTERHRNTSSVNPVAPTSIEALKLAKSVPKLTNQRQSDDANIPISLLQQAAKECIENGLNLPADIQTWRQLKSFAQGHPSLGMTVENIAKIQSKVSEKQLEIRKASLRVSPCKVPDVGSNTESTKHEQMLDQKPPSDVGNLPPQPQEHDQKKSKDMQQNLKQEESDVNHSSASISCDFRATGKINSSPAKLVDQPLPIKLEDRIGPGINEDEWKDFELPTVIMLVLERYDPDSQSIIRAFLDLKTIHHFFFTFKDKSNSRHSWSVEREEATVTVGIERSSRGTINATNPSNGRYDFYGSYILEPAIGSSTLNKNHDNGCKMSPCTWKLLSSFHVPRSPDPSRFLFNTPPTRGADSVELVPANSPRLPSLLSLLAQYMYQTMLDARAIDSEFQAAWGRKVRFDATLGRVRAVWDYALKGAATQREKRLRGEYDRGRKTRLEGGAEKEVGKDQAAKDTGSKRGLVNAVGKDVLPRGENN